MGRRPERQSSRCWRDRRAATQREHHCEPRTENTFHYDSNGNVILLTDTQGRESARYAYDAFGKTLTATGPAARVNRYRFSTKPVEEESGLVYYGYRYYDPVTGRWPSRDPIGEKDDKNVYSFVHNQALSGSDAFGLWCMTFESSVLKSGRFSATCICETTITFVWVYSGTCPYSVGDVITTTYPKPACSICMCPDMPMIYL